MLALFFKDNKKFDKYCQKIVKPNAKLLAVTYIGSGHCLVTAKVPLEFSIACLASDGLKSPMAQSIQKMATRVDVKSLKSGCHAANN